jgi:t-SNARE complex subunit (syntaxin)
MNDSLFDIASFKTFQQYKIKLEKYVDEISNINDGIDDLCTQINISASDVNIEKQLNKLLLQSTQNAKMAHQLIKEMKKLVKNSKSQGKYTYNIYENHYNISLNAYIKVLKEHQQKKEQYSNLTKTIMKNKAKLFLVNTDTSITDQQLDTIIETNPNVLRQMMLSDNPNQEVINMYSNIQQRANEIEKLSENIREIYDMFRDFSMLVEQQHNEIITIESTIENTVVRVQKGNISLQKATEYQKKTRKCMCCLLLIIVIVCAIIISTLVGIKIIY